MSYNFLRDATITNSQLCRYDTTNGYAADFSSNGDVDGWDIYHNIYMYGCWNNVLFGSTYDSSCYISRDEVFLSVSAEEYFYLEFMLKVVNENTQLTSERLTTGKVMWMRTDDDDWDDDRSVEFDITSTDEWNFYKINMGPYQYWQGSINNLRFYPFTDGNAGDKFFLKILRISSTATWTCTNTNCEYYQNYSHPCGGMGTYAYCEANTYKSLYTTTSGVNSELLVNIDDYGYESIELGSNTNMTAADMVKVIGSSISTVGIGGYAYATVTVTDEDTIRITSGTNRSNSSVAIKYSPAAEELCFFLADETANYTSVAGDTAASGFDYASTRLLITRELNNLLDGSTDVAYVHDPAQYAVEGGRSDFNEIGTSDLLSETTDESGYVSFNGVNKTTLELSKRIDNNGKITDFWMYGLVYEGASFKLFRPHNDGSFTLVASVDLPTEDDDYLYTTLPVVSHVECDIMASKGDVIGVYNVDLYVGASYTNLPDATFAQYDGDAEGTIEIDTSYSYGVGGLAIYARGSRKQTNTVLDIDLGSRINVSDFIVSGEELEGYYEFNIASCLDVSWEVDLFSETHKHSGYYLTTGEGWTVTHTNVCYGEDCLDDLSVTADNGQEGDSYDNDDTGLVTYGTHSYFYVNGDAEWLYDSSCSNISEFCGNTIPYGTYNYTTDPVAFTLYFPDNNTFDVFKSIMYFKEEDNFRAFTLSTYNGPYYGQGDADDDDFTMIPEYTKIYIDGTGYEEGDDDNVDGYLFANPTTNTLSSSDYDDEDLVSDYFSTFFVDWTILGHEFDDISCEGFRIYCNYHNSTKITELELYSRVENDVSMVDNATLVYSDYGEIWRSASFEYEDDQTTTAFIGGTPRYFRLTLESQTEFNMREISVTVTDQAYVEDDVLLLEEARGGIVNTGQAMEITNTYDAPFDLTVDIPRDLGTSDNIILWNTLSSENALTDTGLGPSGVLYKSDDFPVTYYSGQCASNCYCYGLVNSICDKEAYYCFNTEDWYSFGTLSSGVTIGFTNDDYRSYSIFDGTLNLLSSKYWKFQCLDSDRVIKIKDVILKYNDDRVDIKYLLFAFNGIDGNAYVEADGLDIQPIVNFTDNFDDDSYSEFILNSSDQVTVSISDSILSVYGGSGDVSVATYTFTNSRDFEFFIDFYIDNDTFYNSSQFLLEFYNGSTLLFYIEFLGDDSSESIALNIYVDNEVVYTDDYSTSIFIQQWNYVNIRRCGTKLSLYLGDNEYVTTVDIDTTTIVNKIRIYADSTIQTDGAGIQLKNILFHHCLLIAEGTWFGVEFSGAEPLTDMRIIGTGTTLDFDAYTSYSPPTYAYLNSMSMTCTDLSTQFVIDLEKRHSLSIVRNYGTSDDLFFISLSNNTSFSNNTTDDIDEIDFDSTYSDCRYLNIVMNCSDNTLRELDHIGVYTDITNVYCEGGGINNTWESITSDITTIKSTRNIAYNSTVTCSTSYGDYTPDNAIDGQTNTYSLDYCWAFTGDNPTLYIEFDDEYRIGSITIHGGYSPDLDYGYIGAFTFSVDDTADEDTDPTYTVVKSVSGVTSTDATNYTFDYVYARRAKLVITDYDTIDTYEESDDDNGTYTSVSVGCLREVEIFAKDIATEISSEDYPIICLDLRDTFNIVDYTLSNDYTQPDDTEVDDAGNNEWNSSSDYFKFSDNITATPSKVKFNDNQDEVIEYESDISTGDLFNSYVYLYDTSVYLPSGYLTVSWEAYYPEDVEEISLEFIGDSTITVYADNYGTGWVDQESTIFVDTAGYFNIYIYENIEDTYSSWGAQNITISRQYEMTRWVAITRDTATNYSDDDIEDTYGPDYLGNVTIYGDDQYVPTEYYWWWESNLSTLYNDSINVKVGTRSLGLSYPTSSGIETLRLIEADTLGTDSNWSINDSFSFYLYINNSNNLDLDYGEVVFGSYKGDSDDYYYTWNLSNVSLDTGWNHVVLNFNEYSSVYPESESTTTNYLDQALDIKNYSVELASLYIKFRGNGKGPLKLLFDDFRISRNEFDTTVHYGKGLCLTYTDYYTVPLSNVTLDRGSIEFYVKMGVNSTGLNAFGDINAATLFTISSNANDILALCIDPGSWFELVAGNVREQTLFSVSDIPTGSYIERDEIIHIGLVWSSDGTDTDNGDTMRLYINGVKKMTSTTTWDVSDTKYIYFKLGGGITQTNEVYNNASAFIYDNLKVYNYCKTSFSINTQGISKEYVYAPENFIEISKDDINYYGLGAEELPLTFEQVPSWGTAIVYVRTYKDDNFSSATSSTAQIIIDWLTTV